MTMNTKAHSVINMVCQADLFIQSIMIFMVVLSIATWTIAFNKYFLFRSMYVELRLLDDTFKDKKSPSFNGQDDLLQLGKLKFLKEITLYIYNSVNKSNLLKSKSSNNEALQYIEVQINCINYNYEQDLFWLGTISSVAPFIGLLGTVWGIINSFQSIVLTQNSSISAVAPGISEALLVTALGLIVAIPALIFNNWICARLEQFNINLRNTCVRLLIYASL